MTDNAKFWDKHAKGYAKSHVKNMAAYQTTLDRSKAHLSPEDQVLEIGCGTGTTALKLADSVAGITGTDISANMIDIAQDKARAEGVENVTFFQADLFDKRLTPGSFDVILAYNVLHLLADTPVALDRIQTLLKPKGRLICKTPCLGEMNIFVRALVPVLMKLGLAPSPVQSFKKAALEDHIAKAGFEIVETGLYPAPASFFVVARQP
ncbi:class I SAM-dependent methyltransferase [Paremcibacter congregatus]|uniref:class I SAM-dependent methyltransferase n=1 Tax=Paremcibacter congregatus TaxID=2043170 RepID=UPI0030EC1F3F|tara:strand:+ start:7761 stop:8384 length:624 start_codon:yes stop_codon:yes gene_type:complete